MISEQEIMIIARQLSISEGKGTVEENYPASWVTTAAEIAKALAWGHPVEKGSTISVD